VIFRIYWMILRCRRPYKIWISNLWLRLSSRRS